MQRTYDSRTLPTVGSLTATYNNGILEGGSYVTLSPVPNLYSVVYRVDEPAWTNNHMQDLIQQRWSVGAFEAPIEYEWAGGSIANAVHIYCFPGRVKAFSLQYVWNTMIDRGSLRFDCGRLLGDGEKLALRLGKEPITKSVAITQKDPINTDFSVWYLIRDLQQLPALASSLLKGSFGRLRFIKSDETFAAVSSSHLAIQFGLMPTISDIRQLMTTLMRWANHVHTEESFGKKFFTFHANPKLVENYILNEPFYFNTPGGPVLQPVVQMGVKRVLYQTTKFYFVYPELSGILNRIKQLVDNLGLLDPAAIWDSVPWSFLIDWLFDVSRWLKTNVNHRLLPADMVICDWGESLHTHASILCTMNYPTATPTSYLDGIPTTIQYSGTYHGIVRKRQFPHPLNVDARTLLSSQSVLTIRRIFLGAALLTPKGRVQAVKRAANYHKRKDALSRELPTQQF